MYPTCSSYLLSTVSPLQLNPAASLDQSLTLDKVISLDITTVAGHLSASDIVEATYTPISFPHLRHLTLHLVDTCDSPASAFHPSLSLISSLLSRLDPLSLTVYNTPSSQPLWNHVMITQLIWNHATASWTRLNRVSFIDCFCLSYGRSESGNGASTWLPPSDLPGCAGPMALSWEFTDWLGGYARESIECKSEDLECPLATIAEFITSSSWPPSQMPSFQLHVGDKEEDLAAYREDLEQLPKAQRDLFRPLPRDHQEN